MLKAIKEKWNQLTVRTPERVEFDDVGVRRYLPGGQEESVRWDALQRVSVMTTGDGPFAEDVYFLLHGPEGHGCVLPHGLVPAELLSRFQALPGFDNCVLIEAMGSCENAHFVCWQR